MRRYTKLTPEATEQPLRALRKMLTYEDACRLAGIAPSTFRRWRQLGRNAKSGRYHDLWVQVQQAEAEAKQRAVDCVAKAIRDGVWQAAVRFLEARYPDEWARKQFHDIRSGGKTLADLFVSGEGQ